ncbi:MAG: sugar phosphate isomerase/epimerase [Armatimonadaceae bacterium]
MKVAVQLGLLPGETVSDKAKWAKDHGVEGIELGAIGGVEKLKREADEINGIVPICSVCANASVAGERSFDFLDPDLKKRRESIEGSKAILTFCGDVDAVGQIVPPIFGGPRVPDLSPVMTPLEIEDALMVEICRELGAHAAAHNTLLLLEPLNRYEQHYLRKQSDGVRVIQKAQAEGVAIISDLFHMHIEETNTPATLREVGKHTAHVHLADNTRQQPGTGDIDFVAAFRALHEVRFTGYMAYECGLSGDSPEVKAANLATSLEFVRECITKATK